MGSDIYFALISPKSRELNLYDPSHEGSLFLPSMDAFEIMARENKRGLWRRAAAGRTVSGWPRARGGRAPRKGRPSRTEGAEPLVDKLEADKSGLHSGRNVERLGRLST